MSVYPAFVSLNRFSVKIRNVKLTSGGSYTTVEQLNHFTETVRQSRVTKHKNIALKILYVSFYTDHSKCFRLQSTFNHVFILYNGYFPHYNSHPRPIYNHRLI